MRITGSSRDGILEGFSLFGASDKPKKSKISATGESVTEAVGNMLSGLANVAANSSCSTVLTATPFENRSI